MAHRRRSSSIPVVWLSILLFLPGGLVAGCGILGPDDDPLKEPKADELTVLFIGSSYLEFNDVPKRFQEMARKAGREVFVKSQTRLGQPLAYHASNTATTVAIRERDWDYVVLQGGAHRVAYPRGAEYPVQPALRELRRKATEDSPDTQVVWMLPWAYEDGMTWVEGHDEDYAQMQLDIQVKVLEWSEEEDLAVAPVGMAFYEVMTEWNPELHFLFEDDWNHASEAGSFLAAAVFYSTIFVEDGTGVPYRWRIEEGLAEDLREVASRTVMDDLESWRIDWQ